MYQAMCIAYTVDSLKIENKPIYSLNNQTTDNGKMLSADFKDLESKD